MLRQRYISLFNTQTFYIKTLHLDIKKAPAELNQQGHLSQKNALYSAISKKAWAISGFPASARIAANIIAAIGTPIANIEP